MIYLAIDSMKLFLRGRLFRDNAAVFRKWILGFVITVAVILLLAEFVNVWLGAIVGGLIGGAVMPFLFRNLRYN